MAKFLLIDPSSVNDKNVDDYVYAFIDFEKVDRFGVEPVRKDLKIVGWKLFTAWTSGRSGVYGFNGTEDDMYRWIDDFCASIGVDLGYVLGVKCDDPD